jgi:hypothetical protein
MRNLKGRVLCPVTHVIMAFLIAFSALNGQAQKPWTREPTSFLGVKFGQPLSASYPECPNQIKSGKTIYKSDGGSTCWQHYGNDAVLLRAGEFFKIYIQSVDGKVASITASFKRSDFDKITKELIAKYGEPQWRNHPLLPTKDGHQVPAEGLNWFGQGIQLSCTQSPYQDEGLLGVDNKVWEKMLEKVARQ